MRITVHCGTVTLDLAGGMRRLNARLASIHKDMGSELLVHIRQGFEAEQAPDGTPWQPLAASTVKRRGTAHPILRVKGRLSRLHMQANAAGATVGSNLAYARIHQFGGEVQRKAGTVSLYYQMNKRTGGLRMVKKRRANFTMTARHGPYTIRIPARPYLFNEDGSVPETWLQSLQTILQNALHNALKGN